MARLRGVLRQLRSLLRKDVVERELDEEMSFHVDMAAASLVEEGMTPAEARREALLRFHGVDRHKEAVRDARWTRLPEELWLDLRYAVRSLARQPLLSAVAVLTIGIGVGATAAVFSVTRALLLEPLPVAQPERLFTLAENRSGMVSSSNGEMAIPYARFESYAEATSGVFSGMAAYRHATVALQDGGESRATNGLLTSPGFFGVLGVTPALGRFYAEGDGDVVVLGHAVWQSRFGGDPGVLGRVLHVDSRAYEVIGVAASGFSGVARWIPLDVYLPMEATPALSSPGFGSWVVPVARLADGVPYAAAAAAVDVASQRIPVEEAVTTVHGARLHALTGVPASARSGIAAFLALLFVTAGIVLVIACTNIAGILLARGVARRQEVAVRLAMGAGRGRLVRQLLTETLVLFAAGGALGMVAAELAMTGLRSQRLPFAEQMALDATPDAQVLVFAFAVALLTGLVFGLLPALRAARPELVPALKAATPTVESSRLRSVFVCAQLALAVVLLVAAGLFGRSLQAALDVEPGFDADDVVVATFNLHPHGYDEERGRRFQEEVLAAVRSSVAVEGAALAQAPLLGMASMRATVEAGGGADPASANVTLNRADAGLAATLRVPLLAGRWFTDADGADAPAVAVVNETAAARLWPPGEAVGAMLRMGGREYRVVGIVHAGRYSGLAEEPAPHVFFPLSQDYAGRATLHVRARPGAAAEAVAAIRDAVRAVDANVAVEGVATLEELMRLSILPQRFAARIVGTFGAAGLLLAALGLYGVLAFYVAQRTREFGIRAALGADRAAVTRLVLGRALRLAIIGSAVGLAAAAAVSRVLSALLVAVQPLDVATFVAVPLVLVATTLAAAALPALRAVRTDPVQALRS